MSDSDPMGAALRALGRLPPDRPLPSDGVTLIVKPREEGLQAKEIPVDKFLAKVVGMRDKLRVLEQRVNASGLSVDDKIALEADITRMYQAFGTLTAFFTEDALLSGGLGMSAVKTLALGLLAVTMLSGALGCGKHRYGQYDLDQSLSKFCIELRWGRYLKASQHVSPELRGAFVSQWQRAASHIDVQDLDIVSLVMSGDGNEAQVTLAITYVDNASLSIKKDIVTQPWKRTEYGWTAAEIFALGVNGEAEPGFGGG